ncbi:hypothetical protein D1007_59580 [Hordeum vulgare]|nr:hypothetical protein D1007_59580 [Hordeum vulgare]
MDKYVRRKALQVSSGNQSVDPSTLALAIVAYIHSRDEETKANNIEIEEDNIDVDLNSSPHEDVDDFFWSDIFDPRNWDSLDSKEIDILAQKRLIFKKLRTTMTQQRLNDLVTIALESEVLEKIDY